MKANHLPKNTSFHHPLLGRRLEIFWQTTNADHFMDNFLSIGIKRDNSKHDIRFRDVKKLLSGNVWAKENKKRGTHTAISLFNDRYYETVFAVHQRMDCKSFTFAVISTCFQTHNKELINGYKSYLEKILQKYPKKDD